MLMSNYIDNIRGPSRNYVYLRESFDEKNLFTFLLLTNLTTYLTSFFEAFGRDAESETFKPLDSIIIVISWLA